MGNGGGGGGALGVEEGLSSAHQLLTQLCVNLALPIFMQEIIAKQMYSAC